MGNVPRCFNAIRPQGYKSSLASSEARKFEKASLAYRAGAEWELWSNTALIQATETRAWAGPKRQRARPYGQALEFRCAPRGKPQPKRHGVENAEKFLRLKGNWEHQLT